MNKIFIFLIILYILGNSVLYFRGGELKVYFLDVGQGDSIYIQTPDGHDILVDGGEGDRVIIELGKVMSPWDREIDLVVLTHPHLDHIGGLLEVMKRYDIKEVWLNPIGYYIPEFLIFLDVLYTDINNNNIVFVYKGLCKLFDNIVLKVLWPKEKSQSGNIVDMSSYDRDEMIKTSQNIKLSGKEVNNQSVVMLLEFNNIDFLLMGDAEVEVDNQISIGLSKNTTIEVLKAGHHCSKTASSEKLLNKINAKIAICSYGKDNKFGHPHKETLDRFKMYKIEYFSTANEGTVLITTNGRDWNVVSK